MKRWIIAATACACLAHPALAAEPIGYTGPDGVNAVPVTPANPLPTGPAQANAAAPAASEGQQNVPLSIDLSRNLRVIVANGSFGISGALPLPSGAASAANQATAIGSLASIAGEDAAFQGAAAMTVGSAYTAQRSLGANCTAAGNVSVTFTDASTLTVPAAVGWQTFPFAITQVNSAGTTATCTFSNLK